VGERGALSVPHKPQSKGGVKILGKEKIRGETRKRKKKTGGI